ncbi:YfiT family bacillithiol transferase [Aliicoccus persicus]|uniref:DinB superfamily protein n=1 Tax=Aliicoccus persicus TaxID=930138 RepID=A0A662Z295_9STAP|nr:putative metal-dependent hydrolase [Aliicoccus persicus]SEV93730.1 DinB superfamily protein [Aliicoccus persicus]
MDVKFPIGQLELPEVVTVENLKSWLVDIEGYVVRLNEIVDGLSEEELEKRYRDDAWTVRELVHHIADSQIGMFHRLKLALTDDRPNVPRFNQDEFINLADSNMPIKPSLLILAGLNARIVEMGERISEEQLLRILTLENEKEISVATKFAKLAWHPNHHLAHIKIALDKK